jgi:hypothetical protein
LSALLRELAFPVRTAAILLVAPVFLFFNHSRAAEMDLLPLPSGATNSLHDWETIYRPASLKRMQEVMGPFPRHDRTRPPLYTVVEDVDCGDYSRQLISYESEPGSIVPAYLLIPKKVLPSNAKTFGILCLHQTRPEGHKVVVGLADSPSDQYAVELVRRGYVCIAPPYPHLANYAPDLKSLGYDSGTMKAIWDNIRALDLLESLPYIQRGQFGAIGHSLGGHNSLYTAAFDQRIKVVATSCGFDSFRDYMNGNIRGWTSERYMPRLLYHYPAYYPFDFHDILAAIAPRSIFISAPRGDSNFQWGSVDRVVASAKPVFDLYRASSNVIVEHPEIGHLFSEEMRQRAYEMIESVLPLQGRKPVEK